MEIRMALLRRRGRNYRGWRIRKCESYRTEEEDKFKKNTNEIGKGEKRN